MLWIFTVVISCQLRFMRSLQQKFIDGYLTECRGTFQPDFAWLPEVSLLSNIYLCSLNIQILVSNLKICASAKCDNKWGFTINLSKILSVPLPIKMGIYLLTLKKICETYILHSGHTETYTNISSNIQCNELFGKTSGRS